MRRAELHARDRETVKAIVLLVAGIALLLLLLNGYEVLLLVFLGIVFSVFISGVAEQMQRLLNLPRTWAVSLTVVAGLAATLFVLGWVIPSIAKDAVQLTAKVVENLEQLEQRLGETEWGSALVSELTVITDDGLSLDSLRRFLGVFSTFVGGIVGALVITILGIYFAAEPGVYVDGLLKLIPASGRRRWAEILGQAAHALHWWLLGRLASMGVVLLLTWLGLALLGMPLALTLATLAGLLSAIPNIGPVISALPALLVAFGESSQTALYVLLLYMAIQFIESYTVTPLIERRAVLVPPGLLLGSQLLMGLLGGFIALLAAPPLLVVAMVLVKQRYIHDHHHENVDTI